MENNLLGEGGGGEHFYFNKKMETDLYIEGVNIFLIILAKMRTGLFTLRYPKRSDEFVILQLV